MLTIETKTLNIGDLEREAAGLQAIEPRFDRVGIIYAEGGTKKVERGEAKGFRKFVVPPNFTNRIIVKSSQAPMTKAELFDQQYLRVDPPLLSSLSRANVCIGRGSLVKLLQVADMNYGNSIYKKSFVLNITKHSYKGNTYLVVEDKEKWDNDAAYGHTIANLLTEVDKKYKSWHHYDYHLVGLGNNFEGPHGFSILLRNEVDAVTEEGYRVEIKSRNDTYHTDWKRYALVVLTGQTEGLCLVTRESKRIAGHSLYSRDDIKTHLPVDDYLKLLRIVKLLLMKVVDEMQQFKEAELVFNAVGDMASVCLRKKVTH